MNVDDKTYYDSVTLQLNFNNGTFSIVNAKPKSSTLFAKPLEPQFNAAEGFTIGFLGCEKSGENEITCHMLVVNHDANFSQMAAIATLFDNGIPKEAGSMLQDNLYNTYIAKSVTFNNKTDSFSVTGTLVKDIAVKLSMVFTGIDKNARSILVFKPWFATIPFGKNIFVTFKDIKF